MTGATLMSIMQNTCDNCEANHRLDFLFKDIILAEIEMSIKFLLTISDCSAQVLPDMFPSP